MPTPAPPPPPFFRPEQDFRLAVHRRLAAERAKILTLLPEAEVLHVGSTSLPGALTKGDLDLAVRLPAARFAAADAALGGVYARNTGSTHEPGVFAAFEADGDPPLGVQLSAVDGAYDDFADQRDALVADPELLRRYDDLKRAHVGGVETMDAWRAEKGAFFAALAATPRLAETRQHAAHRRRLERMYLGAPINRLYAPDIAVAPGAAVVTLEATPAFHHAGAGLHGSVFFKLLDDAAYFAVASQVDDVFVVTASFHVSLLRAIGTGALRAVGRVVRAGAAVIVAEAVLYDPAGREAARGIGDFARSKARLADVPGYR